MARRRSCERAKDAKEEVERERERENDIQKTKWGLSKWNAHCLQSFDERSCKPQFLCLFHSSSILWEQGNTIHMKSIGCLWTSIKPSKQVEINREREKKLTMQIRRQRKREAYLIYNSKWVKPWILSLSLSLSLSFLLLQLDPMTKPVWLIHSISWHLDFLTLCKFEGEKKEKNSSSISHPFLCTCHAASRVERICICFFLSQVHLKWQCLHSQS